MKYVFDTSFLISLIFENDVLHNKACEILEKINKDYEFYINEIIFIEAITVSCYKGGVEKSFILKLFLEKIDCKFIINNNLDYVDYFFFLGKKISVQDCSLISDCRSNDFKLLSFDNQVNQYIKSMSE